MRRRSAPTATAQMPLPMTQGTMHRLQRQASHSVCAPFVLLELRARILEAFNSPCDSDEDGASRA